MTDTTCLKPNTGISIIDGDDGLKKFIDGDELLGIQIKPTELYDSAMTAIVGVDQVQAITSKARIGSVKIAALKNGTIVEENTYNLTSKTAQLTFTSETPFDTLQLSAANNNTKFTFRSVELEAIKQTGLQLEANLANDTGNSNSDRITSDPTITGSLNASGTINSFQASFTNNFKNVLNLLQADGSFTLNKKNLKKINGRTLQDGTYTLHLRATDSLGNQTSFDVAFTLDNTAPLAPLPDLLATSDSGISNSDNITNDNTPTLRVSAEANSLVRLLVDGNLVGEGTGEFTTTTLSDGVHVFTAIATDIAGNVSQVSTPLQVRIDTTSPTLNITNPQANEVLMTGARLQGTVNENGSLSYRFDNLTAIPVTLNGTGGFDQELDLSNLSNGNHTLTLTATDLAGNITTNSINVDLGSGNRPPIFTPVGTLTSMPGGRIEVQLEAVDPEGNPVTFSLQSDETLPTGMLQGDGKLIFTPTPEQLGTYQFTLLADDGEVSASQVVTLNVVADSVTTTRISGVVQNTNSQPLAGVVIELGSLQTVTAADGFFIIEAVGNLPSDNLKIRGETVTGSAIYPFVAEKLPLLLGHDAYSGFNNVIDRPIFLPALDVANGVTINPAVNTTVTTPNIPGASVFVAAGSLEDQQGNPFTDKLSITEVPRELTPAALPDNLMPDLVVTIQPGEMVFTNPAPLSLPNTAGFAPLTMMDLWSINPLTGLFDNVGTGQVSANGSVINTISGGINNSSWHFFAPLPTVPKNPQNNPSNPDMGGNNDPNRNCITSDVELHSGAIIETHDLVSYQSLGVNRSFTLTYDSERADPRPILHLGYDNAQSTANSRLVGELTISQGNFTYQVPGFAGGQYGLDGGEHFWRIPGSGTVDVDAALQTDLRSLASGQYDYALTTGLLQFTNNFFTGSTTTSNGKILHINSIDSDFGSGWGIAGWQEIVENLDGSVLLIDGDGSELLFDALQGGGYDSPSGDFSTLEKLANGTFRRTLTDQTVFTFNAQNKLQKVSDRIGNETTFVYNTTGQLTKIVDPVGLETTFSYTNNKVSSITDPTGRITQLRYDTTGNLIRVIDPDSSQRTWEYDTEHHITSETDKIGNLEQTFYDFAGRADRAILKDGSEIDVDPVQVQGLYAPNQTINPLNAPLAFQLGDDAVATYVDANGNTITSILDQAGQAISSFDEVGTLPSVLRNSDNLVIQLTNARGNIATFTYDDRGNVLSIRDEISGNELIDVSAYKTGDNPSFVTTGDLNGDDILDIVVANSSDSNVSVLLGNSNGTFALQTVYAVGLSPVAVTLGDVNRDGSLDIITANRISDNVSVLLGNGDGSFANRTNFAVGDNPLAIALGDVNNDGNLDIVTANSDSVNVSVLLGNENGTFAAQLQFAIGNQLIFAGSVTLGDVNNDGNLDIVAANSQDNNVSVLLGNGDGTFVPQTKFTVGNGPLSLALSDFNEDGKLDLAVSNSLRSNNLGSSVSVLLGNGNGTFATQVEYSVGRDPNSLTIGDVNNDGILDILTGNSSAGSSNVSVLLGNSNGTFASQIVYVAGNLPSAIALADVNDDGNLDLLAADEFVDIVSVNLGTGNGTFTRKTDIFPLNSPPQSVAIGDLNYDGNLDVVTVNFINGSIRLGNGNGTLASESNFSVGSLPRGVVLADVNGDTRLDIVIANSGSDNVSILLGNGNGTFANAINFAVGDRPASLAVGDVNGDGNLDIVTANNISENVSILLGNGNGTFGARTDYAVGDRPTSVALGDIDGDGDLDIATAHAARSLGLDGNKAAILFNAGDGTFGNRTNYGTGANAIFVTLKDINSDDVLDLIVTIIVNGGSVAVRLGNGDGTFGTSNNFTVGTVAQSITGLSQTLVLADVNEDGDLDLVTANGGDGSLSVLLGNGRGSFAGRTDFVVGASLNGVALDDMDNDGDLDFVTALGGGIGGSTGISIKLNNTISDSTARRYTYDPVFNQLTSITDELGHQTLFNIDPNNGNTLSITQVVGTVGGSDDLITRFTYTTNGLVDTITDALGRVTDYDYDNRGRLIKVTFAKGTIDEAFQQFEYDTTGNQTAFIDENGNRTTYQYDALNRLIKTIEADPDGAGSLASPITTFTYDRAGNLLTTTDALGNITTNQYDVLARLIKTTDALNQITTFSYDSIGNLLSVVDPLNNETRNVYDKRDRLTQTIDPEGVVSSFRYDLDNNLISVIENDRAETVIFQDNFNTENNGLGRANYAALANWSVSDGTIDLLGNGFFDLLPGNGSYLDLDGSTSNAGKLESKTIFNLQPGTYTLKFALAGSQRGDSNTVTVSLGNVYSETFTLASNAPLTTITRTITISQSTSGKLIFDHTGGDNFGLLLDNVELTEKISNSSLSGLTNETTFVYDARDRLIKETDPLGKIITYQYDAVNNLIAKVDRNNRRTEFAYDDIDRLTRETWVGTPQVINYSYDKVSNLTSVSDQYSSLAYTYDNRDRILTVSNNGTPNAPNVLLTYTYDDAGNVLSVVDRINGAASGTNAYSYDSLNRLTKLTQFGNDISNKRVDFGAIRSVETS